MKRLLAFLMLLCLPGLAPAASPDGREWVPLFNGKDLAGWIPKITGYGVYLRN